MSAYGIPYKGGKSKVVKWVIDSLPSAEHFYDLFCGGCAVTHYGMISRRWEQRRYEIAKEMMPWCCRSFRDFLLSGADFDADGKSFAEHVSAQAVGFADALIDRLEGKEG